MTWFIDAWAVRDGLAFISEREADSLAASATVHVAPPWFDCTPVANHATALWAGRGHFQEGLYDEQDQEIGFDQLELAIEVVRRGYVASGRNPEGTPSTELPPTPRPDGGDDPRTRRLPPDAPMPSTDSSEARERAWADVRQILRKLGADSRDPLAVSLTHLWEHAGTFLRECALDAAKSQLRVALDSTGEQSVTSARTLRHWFALLLGAGLWTTVEHQQLASAAVGRDEDDDPFGPLTYGEIFRPIHDLSHGDIVDDLLHIPIPSRWRARPDLATLGDALCVFFADRSFARSDFALEGFIPILLTAKLVAANARRDIPSSIDIPNAEYELHRLVVRAAADWLASQLPGDELAGHPSEAILSKVAESSARREAPIAGAAGTPAVRPRGPAASSALTTALAEDRGVID